MVTPSLSRLLSVVVFFAPLCALSQIDSGGETPDTGGSVLIHTTYLFNQFESLNLVTNNRAIASEINSYIYETLTITDPYTLETIPWIANTLPVPGEGYHYYDFSLRQDAYFSDGHPVTGEDFIFYLKTVKNPLIVQASPARKYYQRVDSAMLIGGDPYRLRVVMVEPYYLGEQWAGGLYAFPKHIWDPEGISESISFNQLNSYASAQYEDWADIKRAHPAIREAADAVQSTHPGVLPSSRDFDPKFLIGSGSYTFMHYDKGKKVQASGIDLDYNSGQQLVLQRNPNYWNSTHPYGQAYPQYLVWKQLDTGKKAYKALVDEEIDFVIRIDRETWNRELQDFESLGIVPVEYDYPAYNYIGYNNEKAFFADSRVRQAMSHALDINRIINEVYFGYAVPVVSPIWRKRPEYDASIPVIDYDLDKAAQLLDEAGWKDSDGDGVRDKTVDGKKVSFTITLLCNSGNVARQKTLEMFSRALEQLGVKATITPLEWAFFLDRLDNRDFDAYIGGWAVNVNEGDMYQLWHSNSSEAGGSNYVSFKNSRVDTLIETIREEFDYQKRKEKYWEIQQILHSEQPYSFLVSERYTGAYLERLRGVQFFGPRPCYNAGLFWIPAEEQWR